MLQKINLNSKKAMFIGGIAFLAVIVCISFAVRAFANKNTAEMETVVYDYDEAEQVLADEVKVYLSRYMAMPEQTSSAIADAAVQNYDIVMRSNADVINDEITDAVQKRIRSIIFTLSDNQEQLTDETLDALAFGVTELIWNAVLSQLSQSDLAAVDYEDLIQSLQEQIDILNERKIKVSINANIIDNSDMEITSEDLLAGIEDMSKEELAELAAKLGLSADDLMKLIGMYVSNSNEGITDDFNEKLNNELKNLRSELLKEISAITGKTGATGATGKTGEKGEQGNTGDAGKDGKTTFIAYADDIYGTNFSLTPTETSKYVGTCITSSAQQPTDYKMYNNWQEYRTYIITSTTDPNTGVTTVHIN